MRIIETAMRENRQHARVVELVDTSDLGSDASDGVQVRFLSRAPSIVMGNS